LPRGQRQQLCACLQTGDGKHPGPGQQFGQGGLPGIGVFANLIIGITNYSGAQIQTDNSGAATLPACNGNWQVNLDGNDVQNAGYSPPIPRMPTSPTTLSGDV